MSYARFGAMVGTATVTMFGLMYLNTYELDHVWFSQTRAWMAVVMGAVMAALMLAFMLNMYKSTKTNIAIAVGSVVLFAGALWLVRRISRAAGRPVTYFGVTAASSMTIPADLPPALAAWAAMSST